MKMNGKLMLEFNNEPQNVSCLDDTCNYLFLCLAVGLYVTQMFKRKLFKSNKDLTDENNVTEMSDSDSQDQDDDDDENKTYEVEVDSEDQNKEKDVEMEMLYQDIIEFHEYTDECFKRASTVVYPSLEEIQKFLIDFPLVDLMKSTGKKLCVWDLDETLIHCIHDKPESADVQIDIQFPSKVTRVTFTFLFYLLDWYKYQARYD